MTDREIDIETKLPPPRKNLSEKNAWLWDSRWTSLHVRSVETGTGHASDIMEPTFLAAKTKDEIMHQVEALKAANINAVLTEGVRHLIRYEQDGKTDEVIAAIRMATEVCHSAGIKVIHHTTTTFAGHKASEFPDDRQAWLSLDVQTGKPAFIDWEGGWHLWCINNPEFRAEYFRLCKKVVRETGVDGLMTDEVYFRANGWYTCVCPFCREKYRVASGISLPDRDEESFWGHFDNEAFRKWLRVRATSVGDFYADLRKEINQVHPHPVFLGCANHEEDPAQTAMFGDSNQGRMRGANLLFFEVYEGPIASALYSWRRISASLMAYNGLTNYYGTPTMSLMFIPNINEAFLSWALQFSHGNRVWVTGPRCLGSDLPPKEAAIYGELFEWEKNHEKELRRATQPLANIAVLFSSSTRNMMMAHQGATEAAPVSNGDWANLWYYYAQEWVGWCEMLNDEFFQYAVIVEEEISEVCLQQYSSIILPDTTCLSDVTCRALVDYVAGGGNLISTCKTGVCDETGAISRRNRLKELGVHTEGTSTDEISSEQQSVSQGQHGVGKWVYFANRPGATMYLDSNKLGQVRHKNASNPDGISEKDRDIQKSHMIEAVRRTAGDNQIFTVKQAPSGISIKAFHQQSGKDAGVVVHLLNCRGEESVKYGEMIPERYTVNFPTVDEDIIFELRLKAINLAYMISPDWAEKKAVSVRRLDSGFQLTIPALTLMRYAVLYVETGHEA